jgi:hypothetical protein
MPNPNEYKINKPHERITFAIDGNPRAPGFVAAVGRDPMRTAERWDATSDWVASVSIGADSSDAAAEETMSVSFKARVDALANERTVGINLPVALVLELLRRRGYNIQRGAIVLRPEAP